MDVKEITSDGLEWIQLAENGFQELTVVNMVVKQQVLRKGLSFIQVFCLSVEEELFCLELVCGKLLYICFIRLYLIKRITSCYRGTCDEGLILKRP